MKRSLNLRVLVPVLTLLVASCVTDDPSRRGNQPIDDSPWVRPGIQLKGELDREAATLPYMRSKEDQVRVIQWFVEQGELGFEVLLEAAAGEDDHAAILALTALASSRDRRLVEHLREIPFPSTSHASRRLAHARAHMVLGDWTHADVLIEGLRSEDVWSRALSAAALKSATNNSFGFQPTGDVQVREAAAIKWDQWNEARKGDPLLR